VRRLPIRLRLTAAFALAMAVVLCATAVLLYLRLGAALEETIDNGLRNRARDITALVQRPGSLGDVASAEDGFAQVLRPNGSVIDSTAQVRDSALLTQADVARAADGPIFVDRAGVPGDDDPARLLALPVTVEGHRMVVVVGTSAEARAEALESLVAELLIAAPVALVLASLLAYALAAAALRPVESMRRRAAAITGSEPGSRLPVPWANDEIARLGRTLNDMLARLELARERERSFVADASHELRTPLALLRAELDLALRRDRTREELEDALRSAADESDRLSRLAEDLLVLARADDGRFPLRPAKVGARELGERVASRFAPRAAIEVDAPPELVLTADAERIEQALGNLVENAIVHGDGRVRILAETQNGLVELHVLDEGPGFREGFAERAFDRFSRADDARASAGAGLGLAIARAIAEAHGGGSGARSRPDGPGADVWIALPR
jgi:two-component system OmpR family sensor kinase